MKNNNTVISNSDVQINSHGRIYVNGKEIPCPFENPNNITVINDKVFVDGYEWKNGEWKRTIRAMWHKWI